MKKQISTINGNNNVQVIGGNYIVTEKVIEKTEVKHDAELHISDAQAYEIQSRVKKIAESLSGSSQNSYAASYVAFNKKFKLTSYKLLPKDKFNEAIKWLDKQIAINRPKLQKVDKEQYRKDMYRSLNARANQLKIDIHKFANTELNLKKPISSLKELSDTRLRKLYEKLFSIRT